MYETVLVYCLHGNFAYGDFCLKSLFRFFLLFCGCAGALLLPRAFLVVVSGVSVGVRRLLIAVTSPVAGRGL